MFFRLEIVRLNVQIVNHVKTNLFLASNALRGKDSQEFSLGSNETRQHSAHAINRPATVDPGKYRVFSIISFRNNDIDLGCEIDEKCSSDSFAFKVISGDGINKYPSICFNNKLYVTWRRLL